MNQRLKSWESPRRQGRNDKGKGGSARQRQLRKQTQMLRNKLKGNNQGKEFNLLPLIFLRELDCRVGSISSFSRNSTLCINL